MIKLLLLGTMLCFDEKQSKMSVDGIEGLFLSSLIKFDIFLNLQFELKILVIET